MSVTFSWLALGWVQGRLWDVRSGVKAHDCPAAKRKLRQQSPGTGAHPACGHHYSPLSPAPPSIRPALCSSPALMPPPAYSAPCRYALQARCVYGHVLIFSLIKPRMNMEIMGAKYVQLPGWLMPSLLSMREMQQGAFAKQPVAVMR